MTSPLQSNNPFRASMLPHSIPESDSTQNLTSDSLLYKTHSTTTTIAGERLSHESYPSDLANAETATVSTTSLPMVPSIGPKDKEVIITVHPTTSTSSMPQEPSPCAKNPRQSLAMGDRRGNMRCSMQVDDENGMWPARRMLQKQHADKKRMWMLIKIGAAVLIIGAAVAIGLGISKALKDGKKKT